MTTAIVVIMGMLIGVPLVVILVKMNMQEKRYQEANRKLDRYINSKKDK